MSAYIPEYVFGSLPDANGLWTGEYGLKPWPAHLRTRPTAPESNGSSESTAFLAVTPSMRKKLVATCEALIALLDEIDGDENLEETADDEPLLGWPNGARPNAEMSGDDDREHDDSDLEPGHDEEQELGWQDEGSQASLNSSLCDGEPDLGWTGHGIGWREGEETDDRERDAGDEREPDADFEASLGWSTQGSQWQLGMGTAPASIDCHYDGELTTGGDGSGKRIAKKMLKQSAGRKKSAGRKGEILFRRDTADSTPMPRYIWNDQWTGNLPPEAHETLVPQASMYRAPK